MAQTLFPISVPSENNATINTLPLVLWSEDRSQAQFKYVLDVFKDNETTRLTRVKFANNDAGNDGAGVIDLAPIVQSYLDYDQPWYTTGSSFTQNVNAARFRFMVGEEYALSTSGSAVIYNGSGSVGDPAITGSINNLWPAVYEYGEGSYDWNFEDYEGYPLTKYPHIQLQGVSAADRINAGKVVYNGDYETISYIDNISGSQSIDFNSIEVAVYDSGGVIASGDILVTASTFDNNNMLRYIGIGPENLSQLTSSLATAFSSSWVGYSIFTDITVNGNQDDISYQFWYKNGNCQNYGRTRFAFINKLGTWDYQNIDLPFRKDTSVKRNITNRTQLQYQDISGVKPGVAPPEVVGNVYKVDARGADLYYTELKDKFRISTDWLTEGEASYISEMFSSPDVQIQIGNYFQPINILNKSFKHKTNLRNQKTFKYEFQYQMANERIARY
jgi:hypothetical protein